MSLQKAKKGVVLAKTMVLSIVMIGAIGMGFVLTGEVYGYGTNYGYSPVTTTGYDYNPGYEYGPTYTYGKIKSNIVKVDRCYQSYNGVWVRRFGNKRYYKLKDAMKDTGHGLREYEFKCYGNDKYRVAFRDVFVSYQWN
ncbi:hypothetical protein HOF40_00480 [Candidatus Parcubacteria bacterium]|jgi:hypothetical protein|nr:hypothetical protein [Candidatus Parcubacteria bacterium]MBT3948545.1 hypothetical protein [Candidatus Parcubacteria bacterium]